MVILLETNLENHMVVCYLKPRVGVGVRKPQAELPVTLPASTALSNEEALRAATKAEFNRLIPEVFTLVPSPSPLFSPSLPYTLIMGSQAPAEDREEALVSGVASPGVGKKLD